MGKEDFFKSKRRPMGKRAVGVRKPSAGSIPILTEGERTEPLYLEGLKHEVLDRVGGSIEIDIFGKGMNTVSLVKEAQRVVNRSAREPCGSGSTGHN